MIAIKTTVMKEIPECCDDCPICIFDSEGCKMCGLIDEEVAYLYKNRHSNCPLVEVKENEKIVEEKEI